MAVTVTTVTTATTAITATTATTALTPTITMTATTATTAMYSKIVIVGVYGLWSAAEPGQNQKKNARGHRQKENGQKKPKSRNPRYWLTPHLASNEPMQSLRSEFVFGLLLHVVFTPSHYGRSDYGGDDLSLLKPPLFRCCRLPLTLFCSDLRFPEIADYLQPCSTQTSASPSLCRMSHAFIHNPLSAMQAVSSSNISLWPNQAYMYHFGQVDTAIQSSGV